MKLIAIDIDGTLVNEKKVLTEEVQTALHRAMDAGTKIVLCTGRPMDGIRPYLEQLGFFDREEYVISQNGAAIARVDTNAYLYQQKLKQQEVESIFHFGKNFPTSILLMNEHHFYVAYEGEPAPETNEELAEEARLINMEVEHIPFHEVPTEEAILKVIFLGSKEEVDVIQESLPKEWTNQFYIVRSQDHLVEVMAKDTNKGTALTKLAEILNIPMQEVMAIGDGENDYEMIQAAGLGVVMANGTERLKGIANQMTLTNEEHGVAHAIYQWVLDDKETPAS